MNAAVKTAERIWSPQQNAFFDAAVNTRDSILLEAVAGSGKTTSLLEAAKRMQGQGNIAILAYNKKIAEEIKAKIEGKTEYRHVRAGTVHSFGFGALRYSVEKNGQKIKVDARKVSDIVTEIVPQEFRYVGMIMKLVSLAKQRALGVIGAIEDDSQWYVIADHFDVFAGSDNNEKIPVEEIISYAKVALVKSNEILTKIDFDDMVYLPLFHKLPFFRQDAIFVDEAQDTNPARRALVGAMLKKGGRIIAVGDPHQAIYGFTGADNDALEQIKRDFSCVRMPLSVSYRCPKNVVKFAQQWVSHIEASETAIDGEILDISHEDFRKLTATELNGSAAILCRNTAPLVELAFSLIRRRIACKVEGREVGEQLKKLVTRWKTAKTVEKLRDKLETYQEREVQKFLTKKQEVKAQQVEDTVATILVIIDQCEAEGKRSVADLVTYIDNLFADDVKGILVLSTIHKSKGREWNDVYWLDRHGTCPSKYARQAWQKAQETNLMYVAATRAMQKLIDLEPAPKKNESK